MAHLEGLAIHRESFEVGERFMPAALETADGHTGPMVCARKNRLNATSVVLGRQWGMLPSMFEVGCDLLRLASLALAARDFAPLGENLLRIGIELVEGEAGAALEPSRMTRWQGRGAAFAN